MRQDIQNALIQTRPKNMDNQEFQRRRESAISKVRQQIDRINGVANSKLLDVYDTGVGSPEHTYQANQRAKANGQNPLALSNCQLCLDRCPVQSRRLRHTGPTN